MGRFIGKLLLTLLVIILVISTTALGVLFVVRTNDFNNAQNEVTKAKDDLKTAQDKIIELQGTTKGSSTLIFKDTGIGFSVTYPSTWTPVAKSTLETVAETTTTTLKTYELKFTKGTSSVTFSRLFAPAGDIGTGYSSTTYDIKEVNSKLIRVANKGTNEWSYKSKIDCADAIDVPAGATVCGSGSFYPGFGTATGSAGFASAVVTDTALLDEVDNIVISALN